MIDHVCSSFVISAMSFIFSTWHLFSLPPGRSWEQQSKQAMSDVSRRKPTPAAPCTLFQADEMAAGSFQPQQTQVASWPVK